jgi:radical SAM superfamily enzyme YgiQ (UPF0313 family)
VHVLLVSTYELGHQPLNVANAAAALVQAGHDVTAVDTAVEPWDPALADRVDAVAFSVPMHTATRLALAAAASVRQRRPELPTCVFGLYAAMGEGSVDATIAGEYEDALVAWANGTGPASVVTLARRHAIRPRRDGLASIDRYGKLVVDGQEQIAGYVEASRGCAHSCRHCPVPVVYHGRVRTVAIDAVVADVEQQVAMGARHITFGDPDFLNAPQHALRAVRAAHAAFPDITFDCTVKVEHVLRHREVWPELAASGCLFVVSAFESVNDAILRRLDKGHTAAEAAEAVAILRNSGIEVRPSWLPFTPWSTLDDVIDIVDFVAANDLVPNVDPVQYTIRLLLPRGSLLLDRPDFELGAFDADRLTYMWASPLDALHADLAALVERATAAGDGTVATYHAIRGLIGAPPAEVLPRPEPPRLSEAWFCCAEPTALQLGAVETRA